MEMEGKTFLVAGAAGFIPSHVCEYYLQRGARVIGLDNFLTGNKHNISLLTKWNTFSFYKCDVSLGLPDLGDTPIDFVLSLASPASPKDFETLSLEIMAVNSMGTRYLLELAKEKKARFLEASTSEVYGDPEVHPQSEDYFGRVNPIGPRACYDESKRFAEALTMSYRQRYGVDTRIARIFNTYGPRMRPNDGRVIPNFITQALAGNDITIYGDGSQTRSFCHVSDLVGCLHRVLFSDDHLPFNCGNPEEQPIQYVAEQVVSILESSSKLTYVPLPQDDPKRRCPDISKLKTLGDFQPRVDFTEGIRQTADYFRQFHDNENRPHL